MNIQFRQISMQDSCIVLKLFKETAEKIHKMNVDHWQYWKDPPLEKIAWVEAGIANREFFFIDDAHGKNIGMVRIQQEDLLYWGTQADKVNYVHSLVVKEAYNGKGMGSIIFQAIAAKAKKENCNYLRLDADSKNDKLCRYYETLDFKKVGVKELPLSTYNLYEKRI